MEAFLVIGLSLLFLGVVVMEVWTGYEKRKCYKALSKLIGKEITTEAQFVDEYWRMHITNAFNKAAYDVAKHNANIH